jgi:hypothetical protein
MAKVLRTGSVVLVGPCYPCNNTQLYLPVYI